MRHVSVQLIEMVRAECFDATTLLQCGRRPFALDDDCARAVEEGGVCIHDGQKVMAQRFRPVDYSHEASFHLFAQEFFGQRISYPNLRLFRLPNGREIEVLGITRCDYVMSGTGILDTCRGSSMRMPFALPFTTLKRFGLPFFTIISLPLRARNLSTQSGPKRQSARH
jgi:hypothetical protein